MTPQLYKPPVNKEQQEEGQPGKEEYTGKVEANSSINTVCLKNLELRLSISSSSRSRIMEESTGGEAAGSSVIHRILSSRFLNCKHDPKIRANGLEPIWPFADPPIGFIDPWSLAARQQKAVLEHAHNKTAASSSSSPPQALPRYTYIYMRWPPS
ncbi:hypothetical protein KSP40_PGU016842 [Platanthera guangdongensis]|uniref:Uncharacterized protein n=1 Tax=Platanthera guangdongensis TaxID=2320717 RepID=A0ABR2MQL6_9ASPA